MPAVTMVAACINAETGVGPAIASGSQVYKGICADLPVAPTNNNNVMAVNIPTGTEGDFANTSVKVTEPNLLTIQNTAIKKPRSPMRFMIKAFLAALP